MREAHVNRLLVHLCTAFALLLVRLARRRNDLPRRQAVQGLYRAHHLRETAYLRPTRRSF